MNGVASAALGGSHSLLVMADGTARAFGNGQWGQLGHGASLTDKDSPVPVRGDKLFGTRKETWLHNVVEAAAGDDHSVVLLRDGTVRTFGKNSDGQLGHGAELGVCLGGDTANLCSSKADKAGCEVSACTGGSKAHCSGTGNSFCTWRPLLTNLDTPHTIEGLVQTSHSQATCAATHDVTISVAHGRLRLNAAVHLQYAQGAEASTAGQVTGDHHLRFKGTLIDINRALSGAVYTSARDWNSQDGREDYISLRAVDLAPAADSAGALVGEATLAVHVAPVNDRPFVSVAGVHFVRVEPHVPHCRCRIEGR